MLNIMIKMTLLQNKILEPEYLEQTKSMPGQKILKKE